METKLTRAGIRKLTPEESAETFDPGLKAPALLRAIWAKTQAQNLYEFRRGKYPVGDYRSALAGVHMRIEEKRVRRLRRFL